jgi:hypothetical protein
MKNKLKMNLSMVRNKADFYYINSKGQLIHAVGQSHKRIT